MGVHLGINDDLTEKQKAELEIDDVICTPKVGLHNQQIKVQIFYD